VPEQYVHRIGRTARAGAAGVAIAFCADDERPYLRDIEKLTRQKPDVVPLPEGFSAEAARLKASRPAEPIREREERPRGHRPAPRHRARPAQPQGQQRRQRGGRRAAR
jgi:ATP-dependent RNA helicase RhlE